MAGWPDKYVIGLTGNIATGKSVVRRMLEYLGAYSIDADALAHRAIAQGAPGYEPVVKLFGAYILDPDGQINRSRLGRIVFSDLQALKQLEAIVHPLVRQGVNLLVRRSSQKVIVIEAIKLLEGDLIKVCDTIWVTHAGPEVQLRRLQQKRSMSSEDARQRIQAQPPQQEKLAAADLVIENGGSIELTWEQVQRAWRERIPASAKTKTTQDEVVSTDGLAVFKAGPQEAEQIADFLRLVTKGNRQMTRLEVMEAFGEKAFLLLTNDGVVVGLTGWQVENLVARVDEFYVDGQLPLEQTAPLLIEEMERASRELQCEAALLFLPRELARHVEIWQNLGYQKRSIESLRVRAWQDAARESMPANTELFFHQLRKDRVLRPV